MHEVVMPRLSDSMEEGTIIRWLKDDGDDVARGEEIVEIETDKATMTYEADAGGRLSISATAGTTVPVGAPIATIGTPPPAAAGAASSRAETTASSAVLTPPAPAAAAPSPTGRRNGAGAGALNASPVARRVAARLGVQLDRLSGSGPYGRILKADVVAAGEAAPSASPAADTPAAAPTQAAPSAPPQAAPSAPAPAAPAEGTTVQELSRTQQLIARRMAESRATVPDFALEVDVDMAAALELRASLKAVTERPPSINDLVVKAAASALRDHPRANGSYRDGRFELHEGIHVGVAVAGEDTLVVPVVRDAGQKSLGAIAAETRRLAERVRSREITAPELSGGTFTVSNLGMFGIDRFEGIVNVPQAAILCVGAVRDRVVPVDGQPAVRPMMSMTLACDHRILYGADGARLLADIRRLLEQPLALAL